MALCRLAAVLPTRSALANLSCATAAQRCDALPQNTFLIGVPLSGRRSSLSEHCLVHCGPQELLSFGWNHLKRDESSCKYHAFLAVSRFLAAFHAPEKIALQVPPSAGALLPGFIESRLCTRRVTIVP